ncbi:MAG: FAD-dependent oxidoreductase, partial [Micromonosporaceae bacterium]
MKPLDVAVVGGGVIGLSVAWRCAQRGLRVRVYDPWTASSDTGTEKAAGVDAAGGGTVVGDAAAHGGNAAAGLGAGDAALPAGGVAAGMIAPVTEAHFGEEPLLKLALASAERWPAFAAELVEANRAAGIGEAAPIGGDDGGGEAASIGVDDGAAGALLGYRTDGTVLVAYTDDDLRDIHRLHRFYRSLGLPAEALSAGECRALEPLLAPRIRGGMHAAGDIHVDPRRLTTSLRAAAQAAGVRCERRTVRQLADLPADRVVLAAGCWSAQLLDLPVRPVKGQILRLRAPAGGVPGFRHNVRGIAGSRSIYLVPRTDGEVVVGATVEELGHDVTVTAGGVHTLLRAAIDVLPEIAEYELVEARSG